jgi:hypothetical protein
MRFLGIVALGAALAGWLCGSAPSGALGFLNPNLMGIGGLRTYFRIVPVLIIPPGTSQVRLRLPPAGAVFCGGVRLRCVRRYSSW